MPWLGAEKAELLDRAVRLDPELADAHYLRGLVLVTGSDTAAARRSFEECTAIDAKHLGATSELARLEEKSGQFDKAYEQWNRVAEARPDSTSLRYRLGLLAERLGKHDKAIENFEAVMETAPESHEAAEARRVIQVIQGQ